MACMGADMAHAMELSGAADASAPGLEGGDECVKVFEGEEAITIHVGAAAEGVILAGVIELDPADVLDPVAIVSRVDIRWLGHLGADRERWAGEC
jgi:hypothetical protein